jgi:hypothetical protein
MISVSDESILIIASFIREAEEQIRAKMAAQQIGECFSVEFEKELDRVEARKFQLRAA